MSDKEFDSLFQEKLYSFEAEPSDAVWKGIAEQLSPAKKKKAFPVLWLAAASIAIMVSFGLWLSAHKEPIKLTGTAGADVITPKMEAPEKSILNNRVQVEPIPVASSKVKEATSEVILARKMEPIKSIAAPVNQQAVIEKIKPDLVIEEKRRAMEEEIIDKPVLAIVSEPGTDGNENELHAKQRRVNTVGSLVNFVVSKVDKRKDKIIQFEEGNEGTMVSGLNLGLLKYQAKSNK